MKVTVRELCNAEDGSAGLGCNEGDSKCKGKIENVGEDK